MENLTLIASVTIVHLLALISPGPDFIVACRNSIKYSRKIGLWTAVGFGIGVSIHISFAFFGLTWVVSQSDTLFTVLKYLGAAYLIFLGISSFFSGKLKINLKKNQKNQKIKWFTAIRIGVLTNIMNPKASLFFLSLFTIFVGPRVSLTVFTILVFILVSSTILWFSLVAIFLTHEKIQYWFIGYQKELNWLFGVILIIVGLQIAFI